MTNAAELPPVTGEEPPDYRQAFAAFLHEKHPDITLTPVAKQIVADQLTNLWHKYGNPELPTYMPYHNDKHTFDAIERGFQLLSLISKIPKVDIPDEDYELLALALAYHDDEQEDTEEASAETLSAENLGAVMRASAYTPEQIERVQTAIFATEVQIGGGTVRQINVKDQAKDIVVVTTALADIGAILFEGGQRLLDDVTNLAMEQTRGAEASKQVLLDLLKQQNDFLSERIKDISEYIEVHCGSNRQLARQIKDAIFKYCDTNYKEAQALAAAMKDNLSDFGAAIERELEKPASGIRVRRDRIHGALLGVVRGLLRQAPPQ